MSESVGPRQAFLDIIFTDAARSGRFIRRIIPVQILSRLSKDLIRSLNDRFLDPVSRRNHSEQVMRARTKEGDPVFACILFVHGKNLDIGTQLLLMKAGHHIWDRYGGSPEGIPSVIPILMGAPRWSRHLPGRRSGRQSALTLRRR